MIRTMCNLAVLAAFALTGTAMAQSAPMAKMALAGSNTSAPAPRAEEGKGLFWSGDDLKKEFANASGFSMGHFAWTPEYRLSMVQRTYVEPDKQSSEMHEDKTQIYFIRSGTGVQVLGGAPAKDNKSPEGQHSSTGPLVGGVSYRIKPGDVILIPPMTWHQTLPDRGQTVAYEMVHIETRTRMP